MIFRQRLSAWHPPSSLSDYFPNPTYLEEVALPSGSSLPKPPASDVMEEIYNSCLVWLKKHKSLQRLEPRLMRRLPWVFFSHPNEAPGQLAREPTIVADYLNWITERNASKPLAILLHEFLYHYPVWLPTFDEWRVGINKALNRLRYRSRRSAKNREQCTRFHFLTKDGPEQFAQDCMREEHDISGLFREAGLQGTLSQGKFVYQAFTHSLKLAYEGLTLQNLERHPWHESGWLLDRIFSLADPAPEMQRAMQPLRFMDLKAGLAEALLLPFMRRAPTDEQKRRIRKYLVDRLKDPRLHQGHWLGVRQDAMQLIHGWLVGETLDLFFTLFDETADGSMWPYRKTFWKTYYNKGLISEAWAVLGHNAIKEAKKIKDPPIYGILTQPLDKAQSSLLLRIGQLYIVEWSHNGSCRIFDKDEVDNLKPPKMYNHSYSRHQLLMKPRFTQPHTHADKGNWQYAVSNYIYKHTNIYISFNDYMPKL